MLWRASGQSEQRGRGIRMGRVLVGAVLASLCLGGRGCGGTPVPGVEPVYRTLRTVYAPLSQHTDQEIVDALADHPGAFVRVETENLRPIGHPDVSAADCQAYPGSQGCRFASIRSLAAEQGVAVERLCTGFRNDLYRKYPAWPVESFAGVPFDPDWVLRLPGDVYETWAARWRNGISYSSILDAAWVESLEDPCCHDGVPGSCGGDDRCVARYGSGNDVLQTFITNSVGMDMRSLGYLNWARERFLAQLDDVGADCALLGVKTGFWAFYEGPPSSNECAIPGSGQWIGPVATYDPCARSAQPLAPTPYAPGEYEAWMNEFLRSALLALQRRGLDGGRVILAERPPGRQNERWYWMTPDVMSLVQLAGEWLGDIDAFHTPPSPGLSVWLLPPPEHGLAPHLDVTISVEVRGNATGPIDYHVWCDCNQTTLDLELALDRCGAEPGAYHAVLGSEETRLVLPDACDYPEVGTYVPKVLAVREGVTREDRISVNVDP